MPEDEYSAQGHFLCEGESESTNDDETTTTDLFVSHLPQVASGSLNAHDTTTVQEGEPKSKKSSKARENDGSSESGKKNRKRVASTRTSCDAFLRLKLRFTRRENCRGEHESLGKGNRLVSDVYEVVSHVVAHNHTLIPRRWQHHHRSERRISLEEGALIEVMIDARVPTAVQYRFLSTSCGGDENVGHTQKDHFNFVNKLKMKAIEGGDAQTVIEMLQKRQAEDPGFFSGLSSMIIVG
ncbi:hypothetical protein RND81_03G071800 [Saponaria officinalis]|uniref:FAR1 domain-containing protein n=1 Tax=Saponaria officinalis TaxID=3572 RepID=A0AAW1M4G1_SAPOF